MSIALIVKGADFSEDPVSHITFEIVPVPCESITLDQSTLSLQNVGTTSTLTATVTPADTTDTITWTSSDETVATVSNGTVTVVGIGTATITATCGEYSDTCTVITRCFMVPNLATVTGVYISGIGVADSSTGLPGFATSTPRGTWLGETGTYPLYGNTASNYYPYVLPLNTTKIKITCNTSTYTAYKLALMNASTPTETYNTATLIRNVGSSGIITETDGYSYTIPTIEGYTIDSVGISMRNTNGDWTDADYENVTIEFLAA